MKKCLFALLSAALLASGCATIATVDNSPVADFDLARFTGAWYELARYDHSFERGMDNVSAVYTLNADSSIKVCNQGTVAGKSRNAVGKARVTKTPGLLRVSFFGPFYSDYRVLYVDPGYTQALVGSSASSYLWILSRSKSPDLATTAKLISEAKRRGYDTTSLIWVKHD